MKENKSYKSIIQTNFRRFLLFQTHKFRKIEAICYSSMILLQEALDLRFKKRRFKSQIFFLI